MAETPYSPTWSVQWCPAATRIEAGGRQEIVIDGQFAQMNLFVESRNLICA